MPTDCKPDGSRSIFSIAEEEGLKEIFLLENSMTGFPQAIKNAEQLGVHLIFGVQLMFEGGHKINLFARSSKGCRLLNKVYSETFSKENPECDEKILESNWSEEDLLLAVPFYDSFLHKNLTTFDACTPNLIPFKPTFFKKVKRSNISLIILLDISLSFFDSFGDKALNHPIDSSIVSLEI